jgi:DNA-binding MarR family transcriptional regulator
LTVPTRGSTRGSADRLSPAELGAWQGFLRANARLGRLLDDDLERAHQLSESKYDVLIQLGLAPGRRLRMTTLAEEVLMSPSGLSRLVDELARERLVVRERREDDGRSVDVVLTSTGRTRLKAANRTHLHGVRELFLDRLSDAQLQQLAEIWNAVDPNLIAGRPRESSASARADRSLRTA